MERPVLSGLARGARALAALGAVASAACSYSTAFECTTDDQCATLGARCEPVGYCSFVDSDCPGGRRFGELSGPYANNCVAEDGDGDAGGDASLAGDGGIDAPVATDAGPSLDAAAADAPEAVDASPDAPLCPTNDVDCDGVLNVSDNCPDLANTNQNNDDGDVFGDLCDPCPPIADAAPPDADDDGVADACDPNPATPGDSIFLFEGFRNGVPASWETAGTWTLQGNSVAASAGSAFEFVTVPGSTGHQTVSASATVVNVGAGNVSAGLVDQFNPTTQSGVECQLFNATAETPSSGLSLVETQPFDRLSASTYTVPEGSVITMTLRREAGYTCITQRGATTGTTTASSSVTNSPAYVGFRMINIDMTLHWVLVVSSP